MIHTHIRSKGRQGIWAFERKGVAAVVLMATLL